MVQYCTLPWSLTEDAQKWHNWMLTQKNWQQYATQNLSAYIRITKAMLRLNMFSTLKNVLKIEYLSIDAISYERLSLRWCCRHREHRNKRHGFSWGRFVHTHNGWLLTKKSGLTGKTDTDSASTQPQQQINLIGRILDAIIIRARDSGSTYSIKQHVRIALHHCRASVSDAGPHWSKLGIFGLFSVWIYGVNKDLKTASHEHEVLKTPILTARGPTLVVRIWRL